MDGPFKLKAHRCNPEALIVLAKKKHSTSVAASRAYSLTHSHCLQVYFGSTVWVIAGIPRRHAPSEMQRWLVQRHFPERWNLEVQVQTNFDKEAGILFCVLFLFF